VTRIDAHQHFWRMDRGDYVWLTPQDHPKIARDFLPADMAPRLADAKIDKTILVQAAPTEAETDFLLALADETPFIAGVVGWTDFDAADAPSRIARLSANKKLVGLRPMLQDLPDDEWMLRKELARPVDAMIRADLCFDALIKPRHLPALAEFVNRYPDLSVVIDHAAKPGIAGESLDPWAQLMRHIAKTSTAFCKLSGLATEAGPNWSADMLKPTVDVLLESFGPSRLMWGSDWPVLLEARDYSDWLAAAQTLTNHLPPADRALIFGGTAATFYGLE
jgi:L-fuconolactonase